MEKFGTKETEELLDALVPFVDEVYGAVRDGVQIEDALKVGVALLAPSFSAAIQVLRMLRKR